MMQYISNVIRKIVNGFTNSSRDGASISKRCLSAALQCTSINCMSTFLILYRCGGEPVHKDCVKKIESELLKSISDKINEISEKKAEYAARVFLRPRSFRDKYMYDVYSRTFFKLLAKQSVYGILIGFGLAEGNGGMWVIFDGLRDVIGNIKHRCSKSELEKLASMFEERIRNEIDEEVEKVIREMRKMLEDP